ENAVREFQALYGLPVTGITERSTWNALLRTYEALLATLPDESNAYPGTVLTRGMEGEDVRTLQRLINGAAVNNPQIPTVSEDGVFGAATEEAVKAIQRLYGIEASGRAGAVTWEILLNAQ
ncbi:MAG: peptidoglycan-binding protein, partial [Clostridia bacterium]|nr:peptidoglycan-binding protein [Clostridia bacterium]